ncbi:MAG: epoxyqueuosine reductase QueH [Atribacterota bacterium]|nr:epoxyqueuosine reductase QueH [Atribacterota bacterium]
MNSNQKKPAVNFQKMLDEKINEIKKNNHTPKLLLHSCCAPCSTYVIEYLSQFFSITVFFYNPNIHPEEEYIRRLNEQKKLIEQFPVQNKITFIEGKYEPEVFFKEVKGFENEPEGGNRCLKCFYLRLNKTAQKAQELKIPFFTTTLTISPHKNAIAINRIGEEMANKYQVNYLFSDFKKKDGFKRSIVLSEQYGLYRQNYCGCVFSNNK